MPKFTLTINLGNDAMQTGYDVMQQLRDVAYIMQDHGDVTPIKRITKCPIKDRNGNVVGHYEVI